MHTTCRKLTLFLCSSLFLTLNVAAQVPAEVPVYLFEDFQEGVIINKSGNKITSNLNYNTLKEQMFLQKNSFSMVVNKKINVDTIKINGRSFIPMDEFYCEVLLDNEIDLFKQHKSRLDEDGVSVGYGQKSKTSASNSIDFVRDSPNKANPEIPKGFRAVEASIYWIKVDSKFESVNTERQLLKVFSDKKNEIKAYISDNNLSVDVDQDMITIVAYSNEIYNK